MAIDGYNHVNGGGRVEPMTRDRLLELIEDHPPSRSIKKKRKGERRG